MGGEKCWGKTFLEHETILVLVIRTRNQLIWIFDWIYNRFNVSSKDLNIWSILCNYSEST